MAGQPLSDTKKAQNARDVYQNLKAQAIEAYKNEYTKPNGKGAHTVAQDFVDLYRKETGMTVKLCYNTLICGAAGGRSRAEANGAKSWLTKEETTVVITYITELGNHRFSLSHQRLKEHVDEILRTRLGDQFPGLGVGKRWTQRFMEKHSKDIKTSWATPLESKRGQAVNPHTIEAYFALLKETVTKYHVTEDCMYGTDEIGCTPSEGQKERVMVGAKLDHSINNRGEITKIPLSM